MKKKLFIDKNILITGASSGIGYALAYQLSRQGANCIVTARRNDRLEKLREKIANNGGQAISAIVDVTKNEDLKNAVTQTHHQFGQLDIVIANAAIPMHGNFETLTTDNYRRLFETNVFGVLNTVYTCLDDLKQTKGTLVIIASVMAYMATPGTSVYSMSKFALRAFTETIYSELKTHEINVVLINPGFVKSEMRQVDNSGIRNPDQKDWVPSFLVMDTEKAARKIAKAIYKKKREKFIGYSGYIGYWFRQYMPWLYFAVLNRGNKLIRNSGDM